MVDGVLVPPGAHRPALIDNHCTPYRVGNTWERYEGIWRSGSAVDTPPMPAAGTWGYLWRVGIVITEPTRTLDPAGGHRDGAFDDACYIAHGDIVAVRAMSSDGTETSWGDPEQGMSTMAWCDLECEALPEPFPTGFFNRMVD